MFTSKICLATVLLSLHVANSYILLTANLDDVHSLAKQIAESPVVNQINDIIRRATSTFNDQNLLIDRKHNSEYIRKRSNPEFDEDSNINKGQKAIGNTEKNLPRLIKGNNLKKDAAPESTGNDDVDVWTPDKKALASELNSKNSDSSSESSEENNVKPLKVKHKLRRSQDDADFAELGRNASFYLTSIKKIFENV